MLNLLKLTDINAYLQVNNLHNRLISAVDIGDKIIHRSIWQSEDDLMHHFSQFSLIQIAFIFHSLLLTLLLNQQTRNFLHD